MMKVALLAPMSIPVPPVYYGGIERMIDLLAHGLEKRGIAVSLYAPTGSTSAGRLYPWRFKSVLMNAALVAANAARGSFDIVNCFGPARLAAPALALGQRTLISFHSPISRDTMDR